MSLHNRHRRLAHLWPLLTVLEVVLASANASIAFATPTSAILKADIGVNSAAVVAEAGKELKHTRNCKALCAHCGCFGFYCGEECICECNGVGDKESGDADIECIATMRSNARKLDIPFQLLIQGPSANRFVRNAQQFEQNGAVDAGGAATENAVRNKRSTVVIYKPARQNSLETGQCAMKPPSAKKVLEDVSGRHKRSVDEQFEWFNDFPNTRVRRKPIGGGAAQHKRYTDEMDPQWFASKVPMFPAAQLKRLRDGNSRVAVAVDAISEDLSENQRERLKAGSDVFKEVVQNSDLVPVGMHNRFGETMSQLSGRFYSTDLNDNVPLMVPVTAAPQPVLTQEFLLPWFRPM